MVADRLQCITSSKCSTFYKCHRFRLHAWPIIGWRHERDSIAASYFGSGSIIHYTHFVSCLITPCHHVLFNCNWSTVYQVPLQDFGHVADSATGLALPVFPARTHRIDTIIISAVYVLWGTSIPNSSLFQGFHVHRQLFNYQTTCNLPSLISRHNVAYR